MKEGVLNYLHISIYFTISKHVFVLLKAVIDRRRDDSIRDQLTAGRLLKVFFGGTIQTPRLPLKKHRTQHG